MKQSLAARFLFRAVVLAFLVYAMLLTWWTPFTGDSFMHSVFGADHRLAFQPVLERCWWSYMHWNPRLGEFLAIFTATAGKWLFLALNPCVLLSLALMMFFWRGEEGSIPETGGMCCCLPWERFFCLRLHPGRGSRCSGCPEGPITPGRPPSGWVSCACIAPYGLELPGLGTLLFLALDRRHGFCRRHDE